MSTADTILYGVVAGIFTSFIIFLLVQVINKIIIPWYISTTYSGIDINGAWGEKQDHEGALDNIKLSVNQRGKTIKALMTIVKQHKDSDITEIKNYNLNGYLHDGHLVLSGSNASSKLRGHITYLLKIANAEML